MPTPVDRGYMILPKDPIDPGAWRTSHEVSLSVGKSATKAWPLKTPAALDTYAAVFEEEKQNLGPIFTDLLCVAPHFNSAFERAASAAAGRSAAT